ncbi:recombination protein RecR [candidate division WWE3 bacterium RIFCSPLOWO2_12_FULL_36_10]|uniref:Recombination protein RecR n=1 Tax=candidate division WWE3 bacterium RIFCSPLOWO2_12_FULL_36_10 TaxID=1802630 RepID=A0A1F4VJK1_UNCKA|nr:MAG: recombination protein RecR [candidate division WWE3 bacterium RIFCSPLOWO2_12_FULL_36_10]
MRIPKPILNLIEAFERLPGIGPKTAQRLTFYLLHFPVEEIESFADALKNLKSSTKICSVCKIVDETDPCSICEDKARDEDIIVVVSNPLDVFAFEKVGFKGKYHVLHGIIDPLNNIGPEELFINDLIKRIKSGPACAGRMEIVLATNTGMEGESTAMYILKLIRNSGFSEEEVKITRIARGIPVGGDIEYADDVTLTQSFQNRLVY